MPIIISPPAVQTDYTSVFNTAIYNAIANNDNIIINRGDYLILGTILVPSDINLDFNNSKLIGGGVNQNVIFETGYKYIVGGNFISIQSNIGTNMNEHRVINSTITNVRIENCFKGFNLYNFEDCCELRNINFLNCKYAVYSDASFYSRYINLFSRGSAEESINAAFVFRNFVNVEAIDSLFCSDRYLGIEIGSSGDLGGANSLLLTNCSVEGTELGGSYGIRINQETGPIQLINCYFENIKETAIEAGLNSGRINGLTIENCWFYKVNRVIVGRNILQGCFSDSNYIHEPDALYPGIVDLEDHINNLIRVIIPTNITSQNNINPSVPINYLLGAKCQLQYRLGIHNPNDGALQINSNFYREIIPLEYSGDVGFSNPSFIPFCNHNKTNGRNFNVEVLTTLIYRSKNNSFVFNFEISDNNATYKFFGLILGENIVRFDNSGKSLTLSIYNNDRCKLTFGQFYHPNEVYSIEGFIRIL